MSHTDRMNIAAALNLARQANTTPAHQLAVTDCAIILYRAFMNAEPDNPSFLMQRGEFLNAAGVEGYYDEPVQS